MNHKHKRVLNKISKWPWGVIVANFLTLATLWFSIYQNNKNENENNAELKRIRLRDSVQTYRDGVKTELLRKQFTDQLLESKKNRVKDSNQLALFSSQISLLNKSLLAQNKGIDIQNSSLNADLLAKQSQLILNVGFIAKEVKAGYVTPALSYSLTNVGNSIAQDIISNYFVVSIDNTININNTDNQHIDCWNSIEAIHSNVSIKSGETVVVKSLISVGIPVTKKSNYKEIRKSKMDEIFNKYKKEREKFGIVHSNNIFKRQSKEITDFYKKYPEQDYTNFIIVKISYTDKYKNIPNEVYSILHVNYTVNYDQNSLNIETNNAAFSILPSLLKCIKENGFNKAQIIKQLKKSTSKNENSFSS